MPTLRNNKKVDNNITFVPRPSRPRAHNPTPKTAAKPKRKAAGNASQAAKRQKVISNDSLAPTPEEVKQVQELVKEDPQDQEKIKEEEEIKENKEEIEEEEQIKEDAKVKEAEVKEAEVKEAEVKEAEDAKVKEAYQRAVELHKEVVQETKEIDLKMDLNNKIKEMYRLQAEIARNSPQSEDEDEQGKKYEDEEEEEEEEEDSFMGFETIVPNVPIIVPNVPSSPIYRPAAKQPITQPPSPCCQLPEDASKKQQPKSPANLLSPLEYLLASKAKKQQADRNAALLAAI